MKTNLMFFVFLLFASCSSLVVTEELEFTNMTPMNFKRSGFGSTTDGKNIYAVAGEIGISPYISNSIEKYDISENKWILLTEELTPRRYCNAEYVAALNKIYIFNGEYTDDRLSGLIKRIEIFDCTTKEITFGPDVPLPVKNAGSDTWNNKIYFFGGQDSHGFSDRVFEFDPATGIWKRLPDMPRAKQTSGKIVNGVLYIFGGFDGNPEMIKNISAYNIKESKWTKLGDLPIPISAHAAASDGTRIWLVGCYKDLQFLASYDTKTNKLKMYNSNMVERRFAQSLVLGGKLYVFGGSQSKLSSTILSNTQCADVYLVKQ